MEYKLENQEVVAFRKTTRYEYEVKNFKGEVKKLVRVYWIIDDQFDTDSNEEWFLVDEKGEEVELNWEEMQDWLGEDDDVDDLKDNLVELK